MSGVNRKFDRNAKRSPSMARYRAEGRMHASKRDAITKAQIRRNSDAVRVASMKVPRGTARGKRRLAMGIRKSMVA